MYASFKRNTTTLYNDNGSIVRRFMSKADVVNVSTDDKNKTIAIVVKDGSTEFYRYNGTKIRTSR